ncbi:MAG: hypothetical protein IPM52_02420 [Bacteroidetes bacterium]|nr:hypothetical protein [Bacteroidota bacterium]
MIPEKLYIPTSSLNFNNIISSESISPASFYLQRGFGYKRFEKVGPNPLNNRILIYNEFPVFEISDNELENYPMVIEIDSRYVNEDIIKENNGNYFADETIYLNPFTTRFIFRNNKELISTISKSEPAIETKMVPLYKNCLTIFESEKFPKSFNWTKTELEDSRNDISSFISKDRRINKLKGLLYGYLIASNRILSSDVVSLKKLVRILKNTLSAIITSPDGKATYAQEEQLRALYKSINERLQKIFIYLIIKEKSAEYQCDFYSILTQENLWESWVRQNNFSKLQISPFYASSKDKDLAFNNYTQNLDNILLTIENKQKRELTDPASLPIIQNNRIINIPGQKEFLTKLFNEYLEEAYSGDEFIQSRYEFAKSGGKVFKDELQEQWNGSPWQQYINGLLRNLNEYSAFELKSVNNLTLESFAAFCQKGESDIDKLEDYLIANEIGDFRIAFSLWGIIFGFANMPKTLTNELFESNDLEYISRVYKHIFKQLHSIELEGNLERPEIKKQLDKPKLLEPQPTIPKEDNQQITLKSDDSDLIRKLKGCKLKPEQLNSISELYEKNHKVINENFFISVSKIRGIGKKAVEKIKEALDYKPETSKTIQIETSLFDEMKPDIGKDFYSDSSVYYLIETLIPKKLKKTFKTDLDWFQEEYKKGSSSQYYAKALRDNKSVIDSFERYIVKKKYANQLEVETIVRKLRELYLR